MRARALSENSQKKDERAVVSIPSTQPTERSFRKLAKRYEVLTALLTPLTWLAFI